MIPKNPIALERLKDIQTPEEYPFAYLVKEDDLDKADVVSVFEFLANPESISQSFSNRWTKSGSVGTSKQTLQWAGGDNTVFKFEDLYLDGHFATNKTPTITANNQTVNTLEPAKPVYKGVYPLLDVLKKLKDREPGQRQPSVLYFRWGSRSIGPVVMSECSWKEESWVDGLCTGARVTLELIEVPKKDEERQIVPSSALNSTNYSFAKDKLKPLNSNSPLNSVTGSFSGSTSALPEFGRVVSGVTTASLAKNLSQVEISEGSKKAKEWIKGNGSSIAGSLGSAIKKGDKNYALSTNTNNGLIYAKSGKNSAVVGVFDGKTFTPAADFKKLRNNKVLLNILNNNLEANTVVKDKKIKDLLK